MGYFGADSSAGNSSGIQSFKGPARDIPSIEVLTTLLARGESPIGNS